MLKTENRSNQRVSWRLPPEIIEEFKARAAQEGVTQNELINEIITHYLNH